MSNSILSWIQHITFPIPDVPTALDMKVISAFPCIFYASTAILCCL